MTIHITLLGSVGGTNPYQAEYIANLLETDAVFMQHGNTFTGKPGTRVHFSSEAVIKIRGELRFNEKSAREWVRQTLVKEQTYQVHHPEKTWFIYDIGESFVFIGNICPRLQGLHELAQVSGSNPLNYLNYLFQLFRHYFFMANKYNVRLDEGLSNFGVDGQNRVFYLDDDLYTWDRFVSCAQMLGVYFRFISWMDKEAAVLLGKKLHELILEYFQDSQYLSVLAEQLRGGIFLPSEVKQVAMQALIEELYKRPLAAKRPQLHNSHYVALLADIHGNLPALEAVLAFLKAHRIEQGIVLGDIVGYGPYPAECIEVLQDTSLFVLKGNHDHGLATGNYRKGFSQSAAFVLNWSEEHVNQAHRQWLEELPPVYDTADWLAVHGAPIDPTFFNAYVYEMTYRSNLDVLQKRDISLCFHGHSHQPGIYTRNKNGLDNYVSAQQDSQYDLNVFKHSLVCPGSVGQPRNGTNQAQFAIYDRQNGVIHYQRLGYDVSTITARMEAEDFPAILVQLLRGGKVS